MIGLITYALKAPQLLAYWKILYAFCRLLIFFFFQNQLFRKAISEISPECQINWIQIRLDVLGGPDLGPNSLQRLTADDTSRQRVKHDCAPVLRSAFYLHRLHAVKTYPIQCWCSCADPESYKLYQGRGGGSYFDFF